MATCTVGFLGLNTISGQKKSFQVFMNVSKPRTAAAGRTAGRTTCQNTRAVWHPSTRDASIRSFGTAATMYWRIRKTPNAETRFGAITAGSRLTQWRWIISMYSGMTPSCTGTSIVAMIVSISRRRPRNCSFANAKPASALKKTTAAVTAAATIVDLINAVHKLTLTSPELNSRLMLCQSSCPGVSTGGYAETAELSCDATTSDQYSGNSDPAAIAARNRYVAEPARWKRLAR